MRGDAAILRELVQNCVNAGPVLIDGAYGDARLWPFLPSSWERLWYLRAGIDIGQDALHVEKNEI